MSSPLTEQDARVAHGIVERAREQGRDILAELDLCEALGGAGLRHLSPALRRAIRAAAAGRAA